MQATLNLVRLHGWDKLSVRMIAKEIGYSTIKIYSDFGSKEKLLLRIQRDGFDQLRTVYLKAIEEANTPAEVLENIALAQINFSIQKPTYYELMFSFQFNKCQEDAVATKQSVQAMIHNAIQNLGAAEPQLAMHQFCAMLYGYVRIAEELPNSEAGFIEQRVRDFIKIFIKGIQ